VPVFRVDYFSSAGEGEIDVRANILAAEFVQEAGFVHHEQRLGVRAAQDEMHTQPLFMMDKAGCAGRSG